MNFYKMKYTKEEVDLYYAEIDENQFLFIAYENASQTVAIVQFEKAISTMAQKIKELPIEVEKPLFRALFEKL